MKSLRKIKTFQLRIYQKTANNSRSIFNFKKLLTGINAKINELSCDMLIVVEHLVFEEIFANYSMDIHGFFIYGNPKLWDHKLGYPELILSYKLNLCERNTCGIFTIQNGR
jgi:hypothetical protein